MTSAPEDPARAPREPLVGLAGLAALAVVVQQAGSSAGLLASPGVLGSAVAAGGVGVALLVALLTSTVARATVEAGDEVTTPRGLLRVLGPPVLGLVAVLWLVLAATVLAGEVGAAVRSAPLTYFGLAQLAVPGAELGGPPLSWAVATAVRVAVVVPLVVLALRAVAGASWVPARTALVLLALVLTATTLMRLSPSTGGADLGLLLSPVGLAGWVAAGLMVEQRRRTPRRTAARGSRTLLWWAASAAVLGLLVLLDVPSRVPFTPSTAGRSAAEHLGYGVVAVMLMLPLASADVHRRGVVERLLASRPAHLIGACAVPLALWGTFAVAVLDALDVGSSSGPATRTAILLSVSMVIATPLAAATGGLVSLGLRAWRRAGSTGRRATRTPDRGRPGRTLSVVYGALLLPVAAGWALLQEGGYAPAVGGRLLAALALGAALLLLLGARAPTSRPLAAWCVGLLGVAALSVVSQAWAPAPRLALEAAMGPATYAVAGLLGALTGARHPRLLVWGGVVALGVAAVAGLLAWIGVPGVPGVSNLAGGRIAQPYGYWNAAGLGAGLAVVGVAGMLPEAGRRGGPAALAFVVVPAGAVLALSLSRTAVLVTVLGLLLIVLVRPRRDALGSVVRSAASAAFAAAGALVAPAGPATGVVIIGVAAVVVLLGRATVPSEDERRLRRGWRVAIACAAVVLAAAPLVASVVGARTGQPAFATGPQRLAQVGNDRLAYWKVALDTTAREPVRGVGAAGFAAAWRERRETDDPVRNAHSLPLETAAELGLPGLGLLLLALAGGALALIGAARRSDPVGATAAAVGSAYLVHAWVDWDWQFPGLTVVVAGLVGVAAGRRRREASPAAPPPGAVSSRPDPATPQPGSPGPVTG